MSIKTAAQHLARQARDLRIKQAVGLWPGADSPYRKPLLGTLIGAGIGGAGGYLSSYLRGDDEEDGEGRPRRSPWRGALSGALTGGLAGLGIGGSLSAIDKLKSSTKEEAKIQEQFKKTDEKLGPPVPSPSSPAASPKYLNVPERAKRWGDYSSSIAALDSLPFVPTPYGAGGGLTGALTGVLANRTVPPLLQKTIAKPWAMRSGNTAGWSHALASAGEKYKAFTDEMLNDPYKTRAVINTLKKGPKADPYYRASVETGGKFNWLEHPSYKVRSILDRMPWIGMPRAPEPPRPELARQLGELAQRTPAERSWKPDNLVERIRYSAGGGGGKGNVSSVGLPSAPRALKDVIDKPPTIKGVDVDKVLNDALYGNNVSPTVNQLVEDAIRTNTAALKSQQSQLDNLRTDLDTARRQNAPRDVVDKYNEAIRSVNAQAETHRNAIAEAEAVRNAQAAAKVYGEQVPKLNYGEMRDTAGTHYKAERAARSSESGRLGRAAKGSWLPLLLGAAGMYWDGNKADAQNAEVDRFIYNSPNPETTRARLEQSGQANPRLSGQ